ncbi:hypothetical protein CMI42_04715 [Candidatus Pacearchaeota archaeon]|nr:hypothetical protein [Candidatus Pacearchaeota archaeon]
MEEDLSKVDIKDMLFWIFLVISLILLIWILVGDSPSELIFITTIFLTMLFKVWAISDRGIKTDAKVDRLGDGFKRLAEDFRDLRGDIKNK